MALLLLDGGEGGGCRYFGYHARRGAWELGRIADGEYQADDARGLTIEQDRVYRLALRWNEDQARLEGWVDGRCLVRTGAGEGPERMAVGLLAAHVPVGFEHVAAQPAAGPEDGWERQGQALLLGAEAERTVERILLQVHDGADWAYEEIRL
jgi:hypothetical protein